MALKVSKLLGLALLGGAGYAAYVYFTDKPRFCGWIQNLTGQVPSFCLDQVPIEPGPKPGPVEPNPPSPPQPTDPCFGIVCPSGQHCENGVCVPDRIYQPPPPTPPPTPPSPRCGEGEIYDPQKGICVKFPISGTGHCAEICAKYPFYSDADVQRYIDQWVHGTGPNDAEMTLILDCWVKQGRC